MKINSAIFKQSSSTITQCPKPNLPEFAFIGRSNVGKSSLINMITGVKNLAKTSATPGKTQLINHFTINNNWYLVDLPGYGYAKTSKSLKESFETMISEYLLNRKNLLCTFILIDSRIPPQTIDIDFMNWCGENKIPFAIVFSKIDKLKNAELSKQLQLFQKTLLNYWEFMPLYFLTSADTKAGKGELLKYIDEVKGTFNTKKRD
jgi:GTP-binding protein